MTAAARAAAAIVGKDWQIARRLIDARKYLEVCFADGL